MKLFGGEIEYRENFGQTQGIKWTMPSDFSAKKK